MASGQLTNGAARSAPSPEADREAVWPAVQGDVVEPKSSPVGPRPQAPPLTFSSPPADGPTSPVSEQAESEVDLGRDDMSVPPVDVDSDFFDTGSDSPDLLSELETRDPRLAMKRTAAAAMRRAHLTKYVTATMGIAGALLIAALVKGAVVGGHAEARASQAPPAQTVAAASVAMNAAPTTEPAPGQLAVPPSTVAKSAPADSVAAIETAPAAAPEQPVPAQPVPAQAEAPAAAAPPAPQQIPAPSEPVRAAETPPPAAPMAVAEALAPAVAPEAPRAAVVAAPAGPPVVATTDALPAVPKAKDALQEKERSRGALERGRVADSIAAGERSVAMDPTDAEAWLILGAAYQQRGDAKSASRSFKACIDQGKRGPKGECAAMLH